MSDDAKGRINALLDVVYGLFVSSVAAHRPDLSIEAVRATEAGLFIRAKAVEAGLADEIGTMEDAMRSVAPKRSNLTLMQGTKGPQMTDITKADHEAALATAATAATRSGATAERTRVSAILGHAEAKGRESLAQHLAFETEMAPERGNRLQGSVPAPKVEPDVEGDVEPSQYEKGAAEAKAALGIR